MKGNERSYLRNTQARQRDVSRHKEPEIVKRKIRGERLIFLNARNSEGVIIRQNRRGIYL